MSVSYYRQDQGHSEGLHDQNTSFDYNFFFWANESFTAKHRHVINYH